ncbi:hypothetical protein COU76_01505 [Candidatus Peregrinibacteria bacterium CG10_big_fil_rev_8_21_14_0_10_49_10]|nr:MAG: hypothetical protein COU76_01505 [Candidatus Peregrinibacteria bacterium CG10_big_fil_rev_8_21_14_0_10_49_10]
MISKNYFWVFTALLLFAACTLPVTYAAEPSQVQTDITLIQSLGESQTITVSDPEPFSVLLAYFNNSRGWILDVAVGFAVVWVLVGGIQFMVSGNNSGKRQEAVSRMIWAIAGLLILLFSGFILRTLNGTFFV